MKSYFFAAATILGLTILFCSCTESPYDSVDNSVVQENRSGFNEADVRECDFNAILTEEEISGLMHMREEEKFARDVYRYFSEIFNIPIFRNISESEQKHMDTILFLINGFGLTDPVAGLEYGEFVTDFFKSSYQELIEREAISLDEAYKVGIDIENLDIKDLEEYLSLTNVPDLIRVYTNLLDASNNHLNRFTAMH